VALVMRRRRPVAGTRASLGKSSLLEPAAVEFTGIATGSFESDDFTPYEFQTDNGTWVRLHDMSFLGFAYAAQPSTLIIRFVYDDRQWTPPQAIPTPVAVFQFSEVRVAEWADDDEGLLQTPLEARGEVRSFDYQQSTRWFSLLTSTTTLRFTAVRLAVHLERSTTRDS
jgi:hypothetical protein